MLPQAWRKRIGRKKFWHFLAGADIYEWMQELSDLELLRQYAEHGAEAAFTTLVARHVNLVYSVARRQTGNASAAEEITQAVFVILARKAGAWPRGAVLSGWLYQTARLTANNYLRAEIRRTRREQEAYMQSLTPDPHPDADPEIWRRITPLLEDAIGGLGQEERDAVVLRFFEGKSFQEIGGVAGATENAAKKRVGRALEKLEAYFRRRGIASTSAILGETLAANFIQTAPPALAPAVAAMAVAKGATASLSTLTLIKGTLTIMAWTKAKTAVAVIAGILLATGATTVTVKEIQEHRTYPWQTGKPNSDLLDRQPPQVRILPSKFKNSGWCSSTDKDGHQKLMGFGVGVKDVVEAAYQFPHPVRMKGIGQLPPGKFDYISCLPFGNEAALQAAAKKKFGVTARLETNETEVLVLKVRHSEADGLKPSRVQSPGGGSSYAGGSDYWRGQNMPIAAVAEFLEGALQTPVIDATGLSGQFDVALHKADANAGGDDTERLKQAVLDQLGLALEPATEPIQMLVVERGKR